MKKDRFWPALKRETDDVVLDHPSVEEGKMFGYPAYYVNGKLAICHYHEGLALKLSEDKADAIMDDPVILAEPFRPMGKSMGKNWVIVFPKDPRHVRSIKETLYASIEFVYQQS